MSPRLAEVTLVPAIGSDAPPSVTLRSAKQGLAVYGRGVSGPDGPVVKGKVLGSERLTGAFVNRLTHHLHILEMNWDSNRLKHCRQTNKHRPAD